GELDDKLVIVHANDGDHPVILNGFCSVHLCVRSPARVRIPGDCDIIILRQSLPIFRRVQALATSSQGTAQSIEAPRLALRNSRVAWGPSGRHTTYGSMPVRPASSTRRR